MTNKVLEILSEESLNILNFYGFVVVHSQSTKSMRRAATRGGYPEDYSVEQVWNRMIAESIREQKSNK